MPTYHRLIARLIAFSFVSAAVASSSYAQHPKPMPAAPNHSFRPSPQDLNTPPPAPGTWTQLTFAPTYFNAGVSSPVLLTDGSVLVQDTANSDWWLLTPDQNGSYINGQWIQTAPTPEGYVPAVHSTVVLPDGRVIVEGGEYNNAIRDNTTMGAIYDPTVPSWTPVAPPAGWSTIGDAPSLVLPNGTYLQGNCCTNQAAILNPKTLTWTAVGAGKLDTNQNEGWTLLPNGNVLTVDTYVSDYNPNGMNSEIFNPYTGKWHSAGNTGVQLWDSQAACGDSDPSFFIGPAILRPDGTVFYTGANTCLNATGNTAIYNTKTGKWSAGPAFPGGLDIATGPAALEPNGKVLMMASPGLFQAPASFLEWDGTSLTTAATEPYASDISSAFGTMLVLPTGQILLADNGYIVEIYTPQPGYNRAWAPAIWWMDARIRRGVYDLLSGQTYQIFGTRFNGMSQGASYGGGGTQSATNYPLVRITNNATGHVFYCRTHDHSSMAVASSAVVSTHFDIPSNIETGYGKLEVVTNGIPSDPQDVMVF